VAVAFILFCLWQRAELKSLRAQLAVSVAQNSPPSPASKLAPAGASNTFAGLAESAIPGRYKWTQSNQEKGIVTLFPDHTFESHKGEKFSAYRWTLSQDRLVLQWNIGSIHYTSIESPGVYIGTRTDGQSERMQKVE
jgi:hypothetical protein